MSGPLHVDRYVNLITKDALDAEIIKQWFHCVSRYAPSGVIRSINMTNDKGVPKAVSLVHRDVDGRHHYLVPLTRDLLAAEVAKIVDRFAESDSVDNFDVETNETKLTAKDHGGISLNASRHLMLCTALAKQKHEDWVRERTTAGWRYGTTFDADEKTHPLLQPWSNLPDRYKEPDMDWPQKLVHMLNDQGYAVIEKEQLEKLLASLR